MSAESDLHICPECAGEMFVFSTTRVPEGAIEVNGGQIPQDPIEHTLQCRRCDYMRRLNAADTMRWDQSLDS